MADTLTTEPQVIDRLARVEEKIDLLVDYHSKQTDDHESRLRKLEGQGARLLGIGSILALMTGVIGNHLFDLASK